MSVLAEYLVFLKTRRKLWQVPLLAVLFLLGGIAALGQGSVAMPFIYALF